MKINPDLKKNTKPANDGYPVTVWKLSKVVWISFVIILSVSLTIILISKKSIYDEIEYIIVAVATILFIFLAIGLYSGAKMIGKPAAPKLNFLGKAFDFSSGIDGLDFDFDGGPLVWLFATIIIVVLFGLFSTIVWAVFLILVFIFSWIIYRTVRLVLIKGFLCKGDLRKSVLVAAQYTLLYTGWILGIVWILEDKPWKYFIS